MHLQNNAENIPWDDGTRVDSPMPVRIGSNDAACHKTCSRSPPRHRLDKKRSIAKHPSLVRRATRRTQALRRRRESKKKEEEAVALLLFEQDDEGKHDYEEEPSCSKDPPYIRRQMRNVEDDVPKAIKTMCVDDWTRVEVPSDSNQAERYTRGSWRGMFRLLWERTSFFNVWRCGNVQVT